MDLVLSGHTHGGQTVLGHLGPVALTPAALASPYVWGQYSRGFGETHCDVFERHPAVPGIELIRDRARRPAQPGDHPQRQPLSTAITPRATM